MFTKSKINDPIEAGQDAPKPQSATPLKPSATAPINQSKPAASTPASSTASTAPRPPSGTGPSVISPDLTINGNLKTDGDVQIEGTIEGDIRANTVTIGEKSLIRGEIVADDIVVNGKVIGKIRGTKVRLATTARVEGDILHKTIAIEAGANFEGSVKRSEDPLSSQAKAKPAASDSAPAAKAS